MSRASGLRMIADARRLFERGVAELEADLSEASEPLTVAPKRPIAVSEVDRARARQKLRRRGYRA